MQEETEIVATENNGTYTYMVMNEDYIITEAQAKSLSPMGEAFMFETEAWWRVEENGSLYQSMRLPEGYMQVELKPDGSVHKHPAVNTKQKEHHESTAQALSFVLSLLTDEQEAAYREYLGVWE